jgi:hypothetical protein
MAPGRVKFLSFSQHLFPCFSSHSLSSLPHICPINIPLFPFSFARFLLSSCANFSLLFLDFPFPVLSSLVSYFHLAQISILFSSISLILYFLRSFPAFSLYLLLLDFQFHNNGVPRYETVVVVVGCWKFSCNIGVCLVSSVKTGKIYFCCSTSSTTVATTRSTASSTSSKYIIFS